MAEQRHTIKLLNTIRAITVINIYMNIIDFYWQTINTYSCGHCEEEKERALHSAQVVLSLVGQQTYGLEKSKHCFTLNGNWCQRQSFSHWQHWQGTPDNQRFVLFIICLLSATKMVCLFVCVLLILLLLPLLNREQLAGSTEDSSDEFSFENQSALMKAATTMRRATRSRRRAMMKSRLSLQRRPAAAAALGRTERQGKDHWLCLH